MDCEARAVLKKHTDELESLCAEHQRAIRELQDVASDLRQELSNLRHSIQYGNPTQPTSYAPPYNSLQPVKMPGYPMSPFFYVPAMQQGQPMALPASGYEPRIPR